MSKIEIEAEELKKVTKNITIRVSLLHYLQIKREKINMRELIEGALDARVVEEYYDTVEYEDRIEGSETLEELEGVRADVLKAIPPSDELNTLQRMYSRKEAELKRLLERELLNEQQPSNSNSDPELDLEDWAERLRECQTVKEVCDFRRSVNPVSDAVAELFKARIGELSSDD